jgi:hypothetical protein
MTLFAGLTRAYGVYLIPANAKPSEEDGNKVKGRPYTEHKPVTQDLWEQHLSGERGLGIIPITDDATVNWAAIDIDVYPLDFAEMERRFTELRLPLVMCTTKSGGAHLLLFCREPVKASLVRNKLHEWAIALGYPAAEVFPKQNSLANDKDVGNWLNMPYYDSAKRSSTRHCIHEGQELSIHDFLELAEARKVTEQALKNFILPGKAGDEFEDGPPCLQHLANKGFPRGGRNMGLFNLAIFARFADGDNWKEKIDEYNRNFMEPALSTAEVMNTIKSASRKDYFYTCDKDPIASCCNKEICRTRKYGIGGNSENKVPQMLLGSLVKIDSDPPMWIIDVEGYRMEVTTDDLLNQQRFRKLCVEKINKMPGLMKQPIWDAIVRDRLANVEVIEAPPDSGPRGQLLLHLENFCTVRVSANNLDEILLGKPYHDSTAGMTYFRSSDLLRYLEQQHFREFKERQVWTVIRELNGTHQQHSIKGKSVTSWAIPSFARQTEAFAVPQTHEDDM